MRTLAVIFVLALITIAFEIYSDAALTSAEVSQHCRAGSCDGRHRPWAQTRLGARLHTGELKIAAALSDAERKVSDAGRATYNARTGAHDDLVLAVAIALWWATTSGPMTVIEPFPLV